MRWLACVVIVLVACSKAETDAPSPGATPVPAPAAPTPPPAPPKTTTGMAECDTMADLYARLAICDAVPKNIKQTLAEGVENKLSALKGPSGAGIRLGTEYAESIRPKCTMAGEDISQFLKRYNCK